MSEEKKVCKYPMQCASIVRNQTFGVEAKLTRTNINEGESPLEMYNSFSRFPVVLINKDKVAATANIPMDDMGELLVKSDFAMQKEMEREMSPAVADDSEEPLSIAYTTKITAGKMKGKSPAEVFLEDPVNGKNELNNHYSWLKDNLQKYPNNKAVMDAIVAAGKLQQEGKLTAKAVNKGAFTIYSPGMRPLIRRTNPEAETGYVSLNNGESLIGKCFVYEIKIAWIFGNDYPVQVDVINYYAPVVKDAKGLLNVHKSAMDKSSLVSNSICLSFKEWTKIINGVRRSINIFENAFGNMALKEAMELDKANREQYSHNADTSHNASTTNNHATNNNSQPTQQPQQSSTPQVETATTQSGQAHPEADNSDPSLTSFIGLDDMTEDELPFN